MNYLLIVVSIFLVGCTTVSTNDEPIGDFAPGISGNVWVYDAYQKDAGAFSGITAHTTITLSISKTQRSNDTSYYDFSIYEKENATIETGMSVIAPSTIDSTIDYVSRFTIQEYRGTFSRGLYYGKQNIPLFLCHTIAKNRTVLNNGLHEFAADNDTTAIYRENIGLVSYLSEYTFVGSSGMGWKFKTVKLTLTSFNGSPVDTAVAKRAIVETE